MECVVKKTLCTSYWLLLSIRSYKQPKRWWSFENLFELLKFGYRYTEDINSKIVNVFLLVMVAKDFGLDTLVVTRVPIQNNLTMVNNEPEISPNQIKVVIVTGHRSGGTFISELFNQNSEAFFIFEPLGSVQPNEPTVGCGSATSNKICQLKRYLNCESPTYVTNRNGLKSQTCTGPVLVPLKHPGSCSVKNLCFRQHSRWSCNPRLCSTPMIHQTEALMNNYTIDENNVTSLSFQQCGTCNKLNPLFMDLVCKTKKIIAIKGI